MYHIDLGLNDEQVKQLRQLALDYNTSVRSLVTELVVKEIQEIEAQKTKESKKQKEETKS